MKQPKFPGEFEETYYHNEGYITLDPNIFYMDNTQNIEENVQKPIENS